MPLRDAIRDTETQKAMIGLLIFAVREAIPIINTWRITKLKKRVDAHHKVCREHRNNNTRHRTG